MRRYYLPALSVNGWYRELSSVGRFFEAKKSDEKAKIRCWATFVVPRARHKWTSLGRPCLVLSFCVCKFGRSLVVVWYKLFSVGLDLGLYLPCYLPIVQHLSMRNCFRSFKISENTKMSNGICYPLQLARGLPSKHKYFFTQDRLIESPRVKAETTHHRGKHYCTADLLFEWFGFDQRSKTVVNSTKGKQLNPNKINRRSVAQCYFPLS